MTGTSATDATMSDGARNAAYSCAVSVATRAPNDGCRENSAQGRNRTTDTGIFSPLLYRLSYLGVGLCEAKTAVLSRSTCGISQGRC